MNKMFLEITKKDITDFMDLTAKVIKDMEKEKCIKFEKVSTYNGVVFAEVSFTRLTSYFCKFEFDEHDIYAFKSFNKDTDYIKYITNHKINRLWMEILYKEQK